MDFYHVLLAAQYGGGVFRARYEKEMVGLPRNVIDGILCPVGGDAGTWELRNRDANVRRRKDIVDVPRFLISGRGRS